SAVETENLENIDSRILQILIETKALEKRKGLLKINEKHRTAIIDECYMQNHIVKILIREKLSDKRFKNC
ncbi:hypothetical protein M153_13930002868, partial [Pseudoloma neurophilia]